MAKSKGAVDALGRWSFLIGFIVAVLIGLFTDLNPTMAWVLFLIGILVGLLNVADKEVMPFLMSGAVLVIVASQGIAVLEIIPQAANVLGALLVIFVPATAVVAIKNVFGIARD